jgi:hypothetical protein
MVKEIPEFRYLNIYVSILNRKAIVIGICVTSVLMKMDVFWVVAPCSLVEVYRSFRGPCCRHHQGDRHLRAHRRAKLKSYPF